MKKIIALLFVTLFLASCNPAASEKAKDNTRITDLHSIQSSLEVIYSDTMEYPNSILEFSSFPIDPNQGELIHGCKMGYKYEVSKTLIPNDTFRLSTCFESKSNKETKAMNDGGIYDDRYEVISK